MENYETIKEINKIIKEMEIKAKLLGINDDKKLLSLLINRIDEQLGIQLTPNFIVENKNSIVKLGELAPLFALTGIFNIDCLNQWSTEISFKIDRLGTDSKLDLKEYIKYSVFLTSTHRLFDVINGGIDDSILNELDTRNVNNFSFMFKSNTNEKLDLSSMNMDNAVNTSNMFYYCSAKEIILKNFIGKKVKYMQNMFRECKKLERLDLSSIDIDENANTDYMFYGCNNLKEIVTSNEIILQTFKKQIIQSFRLE